MAQLNSNSLSIEQLTFDKPINVEHLMTEVGPGGIIFEFNGTTPSPRLA